MATEIYHHPAADDSGFYRIAANSPDRLALVAPDGTEVSFGQLADIGNRISNELRRLGVGKGDVVASLQVNSVQHYEVLLGASQIGAYFAPVNTHLTRPEIEYILEDSGAKVLFASKAIAEKIVGSEALPEHRFITDGTLEGWGNLEELKSRADNAPPEHRISGMMLCYTSGTTGKPKAVKRAINDLSPETVAMGSVAFLQNFGIRSDAGVQLLFSPVYHAAPGNMTFSTLQLGHTIVIQEKFDPESVLAAIEKYRVTGANAVPTQMHRLYSLPAEIRAKYDTSSLENILVAGAPFHPNLKANVLEWLGPVVWEYLAATEGLAAIVSPQEALEHPGTVGKATDVLILDDEGLEAAPGQVGTIYFKLTAEFEYHNAPEKTAEVLREGGYATAGDLGYLDEDKYLFLLDRRVDLIISGGVNVYPAEVEQRLDDHPAVADVAVVGLSDEEWGHRVVAVVQLAEGISPSDELTEELQAFCRETLTGAKVPRLFKYVDALPRTEVGKLLRRHVRDEIEAEQAGALAQQGETAAAH